MSSVTKCLVCTREYYIILNSWQILMRKKKYTRWVGPSPTKNSCDIYKICLQCKIFLNFSSNISGEQWRLIFVGRYFIILRWIWLGRTESFHGYIKTIEVKNSYSLITANFFRVISGISQSLSDSAILSVNVKKRLLLGN